MILEFEKRKLQITPSRELTLEEAMYLLQDKLYHKCINCCLTNKLMQMITLFVIILYCLK